MLVKFRIHEIFLGVFLTIAVFELGFLFASQSPQRQPSANESSAENCKCEVGEPESFVWRTFTDPVSFFTLWIAAFTGILGLATIKLAKIGSRQFDDTRILQRAYLSVKPLGIIPFSTTHYSFAHVGIKNAGRLPAREVKWNFRVTPSTCRRFKPEKLEIEEDDLPGNVIVPGATMLQARMADDGTITDDIYRTFAREKSEPREPGDEWYIYIWGVVRYDDGFGKVRRTRFCHRYYFRGFVEKLTKEAHRGLSGITADYGVRDHEWGNDGD